MLTLRYSRISSSRIIPTMLKQQAAQLSTSPLDIDHHSHDHDHHHDHFHSHENESPFTLTKESSLKDYLYNNKLWVEKMNDQKPGLFESNGKGQAPHTLWIGCSDSRYNETVLNIAPGEVFAFKNIANMISIDDLTTVSTLEFSINVLKVKKNHNMWTY